MESSRALLRLTDPSTRRFVVPLHRARTDFDADGDPREGRIDLAARLVTASLVASQRLRHNSQMWLPFLGDSPPSTLCVTGGAVRMGGAKVEDYAPKLTLDDAVTEDVNARLGVATAKEIEDILAAHRDKDFLRLLKLREVPIDSLGKVEWSGHEAVKTNEIAMRCKLLSLRLDKSRNAHAKAPAAQRAVKNVLDLLSHKDTRKEYLTLAVRRKVEELRAEGKIQGGGHVSFTGVHYGSGAAATRAAEENYVSKDMLNEMPTYDETIHLDMSDENARAAFAARGAEPKKSSAPKVDVSSIRAKLASKTKKPRFM